MAPTSSFTHALVIINPGSGQQDPAETRQQIEARLKEGGLAFEIRETAESGDALQWAEAAQNEGFDLMVANVGQIGTTGPKLGPRIQPHDGKLDVIVATSASLLGALRILFRILTGRFDGGGDLHYLQVEHVTITARPSLPTEIDGETLG